MRDRHGAPVAQSVYSVRRVDPPVGMSENVGRVSNISVLQGETVALNCDNRHGARCPALFSCEMLSKD
jgi:hypothetical protein